MIPCPRTLTDKGTFTRASDRRPVAVRNFVINGNERHRLHDNGWVSGDRTAGPYGKAHRRHERSGPYGVSDFGRRRRSQQMTATKILTAAPSRVKNQRMNRGLHLMIEGYCFHAISLEYHTAHGERRQIGCPCKSKSEIQTVAVLSPEGDRTPCKRTLMACLP